MLTPTITSTANPDAYARRRYLAGVDVGASTIRAGVFTEDMEFVGKFKINTKSERGPVAIVERVARCLEYAVDECDLQLSQIKAVGIGIPGRVHTAAGIVLAAPSLSWREVPLRQAMEKLLRLPAFLENKHRLAALGVFADEFASEPRRFAALFPGREIGGGILMDGQWLDTSFVTGKVPAPGDREGVFAVLTGEEFSYVRNRELRKAVRQGDKAAEQFVRRIAMETGRVAADLMNRFALEVIALGGEVVEEMKEEFVRVVEQAARARTRSPSADWPTVAVSRLGNLAGMTGAAVFAAEQLAGASLPPSALDALQIA